MTLRRVRRLTALLVATLWSGLMFVGGLWAATVWSGRYPAASSLLAGGGLVFMAMGLFVFATLVADRVFPRASTAVSGSVELLAWVVVAAAMTGVATQW